MGKGRAPCCEKGKVKRGPWSPAEDLKLITFIQKNGHDNWRSLPKQSGLVRCGKSCRLRWINYLRPDVKRGNFTKEEEENIIKLHETLGNKWSKIASHFPGRTDNEIKNVWNTHLKKKLAKIANNSANESKESSIITTSSSSSSTNSILSGRKRNSKEAVFEEEESDPKRSCRKSMCCEETLESNKEDVGDNNSTTKEGETNDGVFSALVEESLKQHAMLSTTTSSNSFYGSNGSSTTPHIDHHVSKLGNLEDETLMDGLLLDFEGPFDVDAILQEVNQPDQEVMLSLLEDNNDDSFWDMCGPNSITIGSTLFDPKSQKIQVLDNNDLHQNSCLNSIFGEKKCDDIANNKEWFRYLESELGLEAPVVDKCGQKEEALDQNYHAMAIEEVSQECNFFDLEPKREFSPSTYDLWPSN